MIKKYKHRIFFFFFFLINLIYTQEIKSQTKGQDSLNQIEGLSLYPNPVSSGKIYITSKNDSEKEIVIFNVLGVKVLQSTISSHELNVSSLPPGVYIIKIEENQASTSRKLIIK